MLFKQDSSVFCTSPIPRDAEVIFVSDMFVEDYVGGAELTSQALIDSSPFKIQKIHSRNVTLDTLKQCADKFWIFGNFAELNPQLIPSIVGNLKYSILEYDFKYCKYRSPEKHFAASKIPCDCHNQINGKMISAFYYGVSGGLWWMSDRQRERYSTLFPFLDTVQNTTISSIFDEKTIELIRNLRKSGESQQKSGWIILGSDSWVKGADAAKKWCEENGKQYTIVWNMPYKMILEKLSIAEGFVYLPAGGDTCPRMVIEAKLLGCKLQLNENVLHKNEVWFNKSIVEIEQYLLKAPENFWSSIKKSMSYRPTISGYTTTYNAVKQQYPYKECIQSMLQFCDEVCIVDGGSDDGTWESLIDIVMESQGTKLSDLSEIERSSTIEMSKSGATSKDAKLRIKQIKRDWKSKGSAIFDGLQKAEARNMCTQEFCWQMDSDEIVHEDDLAKIKKLPRAMVIPGADILSLPVIEYWGGEDKVRCDIMPWKWRFSKNLPHITHGIPYDLRRFDQNGSLYAAPGTDGCDMIDKDSGERLMHVCFYDGNVDAVRQNAVMGNVESLKQYEGWFNSVINELPGVHHYSWFNIARKIRLYRDFWTRHWLDLQSENFDDSAEQNMMFDVPWSQVTDEMIENRAKELGQMGGHIWHSKWNGRKTPWIQVNRSQPQVMKVTQ